MTQVFNTGRVGSILGSFACKIIGKLPSIDPTQPVRTSTVHKLPEELNSKSLSDY